MTSNRKVSDRRNLQRKPSPVAQKRPARPSNPPLWPKVQLPALWAVALFAALAGCYFWNAVSSANGANGFPLDDSWIHLTFARTLAQTGRFAFGPLNHATSGSTSPLFTILEALLFLVTSNEFAIAKLLSVAGLAIAAFYVFRTITSSRPAISWLPLVAGGLVIVSPHFLPASAWGMETTLAGAFIAAAACYYERGAWRALGVTLGLSLWCRPDLVIVPLALAIDFFVLRREYVRPDWKRLLVPSIVLGLGYLAFNFALSGSLLPNTFAAKLAYYSSHRAGFWSSAWEFFTSESQGVMMALAIVGLLIAIFSAVKKKPFAPLYPYLMALGYVALYAWKLPYLYQDGRYLVPAVAAVVLAAAFGAIALAEWIGRGRMTSALATIILTVALLVQLSSLTASDAVDHEALQEAYISRLQVATAQWCAKNLPKDAAIATHDIGAIGFYSARKTVDMVGLVDPEIIPSIGDPVKTVRFLRKRGATYAALLDNWFEIVNENPANIVAPPQSERMLVYPMHDSTRMAGATVLSIHKYLREAIAARNTDGVDQALEEATRLEPWDALTYILGGEVYLQMHQIDKAIPLLERAVALFPTSDWATHDLQFATAMGKR